MCVCSTRGALMRPVKIDALVGARLYRSVRLIKVISVYPTPVWMGRQYNRRGEQKTLVCLFS